MEEIRTFGFGEAVNEIKNGKACSRLGWNGKDMFIYYVEGGNYKSQSEVAKKMIGEFANYRPYIALYTAQKDVSFWSPSVSDSLANDWYIVG